jgi:L-asparaginase
MCLFARLVIYMGGTLGMKKDPLTGALAPALNYLESQMAKLPELAAAEMPNYKVRFLFELLKLN